MIILFTFTTLAQTLAYNQKDNPYREVGDIIYAGLDDVATHIDSSTPTSVLATNFIVATYGTTNNNFTKQSVMPIAVKGYNMAIDPQNNLDGIDLGGWDNMYIDKAFNFIDNFPPSVAANTIEKSYAIFGDNNSQTFDLYESQLLMRLINMKNEILECSMPDEQKILPLIAHEALGATITYWQAVYFNDGGSNAWYDYITGNIADIKGINWRQTIKVGIKGALAGAIAGGLNNPDNNNAGVTIGAAAAAIAASAQDIVLQVAFTSVFDPA